MSTTDTSEKGLESLIVAAMAGEPVRTPASGSGRCAQRALRRHGLAAGRLARLRPRVLRRPGAAYHLPAGHPAQGGRRAGPVRGWPDAAQVPGAAARGDQQARDDRRAAQRRQARAAPARPVLRHAYARQYSRRRALCAEPLQRHPATALQPRSERPGPRPVPLHQRPAHRHLRAEEQPDQADRGRCGGAVQA